MTPPGEQGFDFQSPAFEAAPYPLRHQGARPSAISGPTVLPGSRDHAERLVPLSLFDTYACAGRESLLASRLVLLLSDRDK